MVLPKYPKSRSDDNKRDWRKYNKSLVRRGEILLDFDEIESWGEEVKEGVGGISTLTFLS
ncbi:MAG: hypothetical protein JZD40_06470 [Sulfolobus sp.]|nr:hypothetical protein [Sulfolobus sp.]